MVVWRFWRYIGSVPSHRIEPSKDRITEIFPEIAKLPGVVTGGLYPWCLSRTPARATAWSPQPSCREARRRQRAR
jgi:hypothetical protein